MLPSSSPISFLYRPKLSSGETCVIENTEGRITPPSLQNCHRKLSDCMSGTNYEHPLVLPHVSHFRQVPLRTIVKLEHSEHMSPV